MSKMIDYITPQQRVSGASSLEAKRQAAIGYLRSIGRYVLDRECKWRPSDSHNTDVRATWRRGGA